MIAVRWLAAPIIWAAHLLAVYGSEALLCTRGGGPGAHRVLLAVATILALAALIAVAWRAGLARANQDPDGHAFMTHAQLALGVLAAVAVLWTALPAAFVTACLPPA